MHRHAAFTSLLSLTLSAGLLTGCVPAPTDDEDASSSDLSKVPDSVIVNGQSYDVETEYLPRVVQCENPGAPPESLRAQAIAARTYLTSRTAGQAHPTIPDGQNAQVFTCSANQRGQYVPPTVVAAVNATRGQIVLHNGTVTAGFFVAGAKQDADCQPTTDPTNTQRYVTVNVGKSGSAVTGSSIGSRSDPSNRGAMGQLQANCLAGHQGLVAAQLLAYFYGADIEIRGVASFPPAPAPMPTQTDPMSSDPSTVPSEPDDPPPSDTPPPAMENVCSTDQATSTCWSYTLQCWTPAGICVQSAADQKWYQCVDMEGWVGGVDPNAMTGVLGPCTISVPLPTSSP